MKRQQNKTGSEIDLPNFNSEQNTNDLSSPFIRRDMNIEEYNRKGWKKEFKESCGSKFKRIFFGPSKQTVRRKIRLNGEVLPKNHQLNSIKNTKYTPISFIPKVLFDQFKLFFNLFFLLLSLSQLISVLKVGYAFTYFAPLALVLTMTMIKELYDDIQRYRRDSQANSEKYSKLTKNGLVTLKSKDIRVGDIIEIQKGQRIPADILLLYNDNPNGAIFVKTDQLDGETDWKLRKAVRITQNYVNSQDPINGIDIPTFNDNESQWSEVEEQKQQKLSINKQQKKSKTERNDEVVIQEVDINIGANKSALSSPIKKKTEHKTRGLTKQSVAHFNVQNSDKSKLLDINCYVKVDQPIENIYEFIGVLKARNNNGQAKKESLSLENTLWTNMVLSTGTVLGLVLYCGKESRMEMNSRDPRTKLGSVDYQISFLSKLLFVVLIFISGSIMVLRPPTPLSTQWISDYMRYLILLSNVIPISLKVNLDFAKLLYSIRINLDKDIPGTMARNSSIPEELGRIQYLLSDKTGTLTQNDMIFKRLALENYTYTDEDKEEIKKQLKKQFTQYKSPISDMEQMLDALKSKKKFQRQSNLILRDIITALAVCHNVTPIYGDNGEKEYQASSPDEIALVTLAENMGLTLHSREQDTMTIKNCLDEYDEFKILKIFPFSSDTKRMGIIVRHCASDKLIFYLKGADVIMKQFLPEKQRGYVDEQCSELAREGLRTLVITQKLLNIDDYKIWEKKYKEAEESLDERAEKLQQVIGELEKNMEFLGVTGVEDKLQENVTQTLEDLRQAGIKVWMLTGDKIETAICISISSGLKDPKYNIFQIKEISDEVELQAKLQEFNRICYNNVLVIDGDSLKIALEKCEKLFVEAASKAPSVVCCRCSPTQKAKITEKIKEYTKKITCSIGDGGNDVGMIQQANVGVGIVGKEGKQAALAADYSITKFKYITKLFLWHGRHSYKRSSLLSQFVLHRGLIITIMQMIFICCFYFVSLPIFNSNLLLGYTTVFTMFPVFCLVFDEDVDKETALKYPPLYKSLLKGRELNTKTFIGWVFRALYSGTCITCMCILWIKNSFLLMQSLLFSILIFIEYIMTLTELQKLHVLSIISTLGSLIVYLIIWFVLPGFFEIKRLTSWTDFGKTCVIVIASYGPIILVQYIRKFCYPTDYEIIIKSSKRENKLMNTKILAS